MASPGRARLARAPNPSAGPVLFNRAADAVLFAESWHKSITTTADTYKHLDCEDLEEAMRLAYLRWQEVSDDKEAD
jgi:hypothetical protein